MFFLTESDQNVTTDMNNTMDIEPVNVTIAAPPEVFNVSSDRVGFVLTFYSTPNLFQVKEPEGYNASISGDFEFVADSAVVGLNISRDAQEVSNLADPVNITLQSLRALSGQVNNSSCTVKKSLCFRCLIGAILYYRIGRVQSVFHGTLMLLMVQRHIHNQLD